MPLHWERLRGMTSAADTFASFYATQPGSFWLDRSTHPTERFSVMGSGELLSTQQSSDFSVLAAALKSFSADASYRNPELEFSWRPGLVGVLHYDGQAQPNAQLGEFLRVDRAIVFAHDERAMYFVGDFEARADFEIWYHAALLRLALIGGDSARHELANDSATSIELTAELPRTDYLSAIAAAQQAIASGEVYQLCLTNRLRGEFTGDPLSYYLRLRRSHQAPYSSFFKAGGQSYCSISPERLLTVTADQVISSPIKGTRRRGADEAEDLKLLAELSLNDKERAENLMIVDLVRNDLAKVCLPESVAVTALLEARSYSTVHQLVSDVSGQLRPEVDSLTALRSVFPAGSMTGAPKIRAMQLIDQLERSNRMGYSGGIGFIAATGDLDLGMVIRTAVFSSSEVTIGVGGGLTAESEPEAEHEETQLKAEALVSALGAGVRW
jgi:anthranilate/para-aminobenzoate synthase component I